MPRKKPVTVSRNHYSKDLKRRIIYQAYTLGKKTTEIAIDLNMHVRVVQRVKKTWKEIGEVCRDRTYIGRAPMLSPEKTKLSIVFPIFTMSTNTLLYEFMLALIEHSPDIFLDEIQEQLFEQHDLEVSLSPGRD